MKKEYHVSNGFRLISPENFKALSEGKKPFDGLEVKLNIIHDYLHDLHVNQGIQAGSCENRFSNIDKRILKLERRKLFDTSVGAGSGFLGGLLTILGKYWLGDGK